MESVATCVVLEFKVNKVNYILEMKDVENSVKLNLSKAHDLNFWVQSNVYMFYSRKYIKQYGDEYFKFKNRKTKYYSSFGLKS